MVDIDLSFYKNYQLKEYQLILIRMNLIYSLMYGWIKLIFGIKYLMVAIMTILIIPFI